MPSSVAGLCESASVGNNFGNACPKTGGAFAPTTAVFSGCNRLGECPWSDEGIRAYRYRSKDFY